MLRPPIAPMRAVGVPDLPAPAMCRAGCAYEVKFDGWRCICFVRPGGAVYLQSRQAKSLTRFFPDVVAAVQSWLTPGTVVDGELIIFDSVAGRTTFPALLGRVSAGRRLPAEAAARPATLVVFDILAHDGVDLTGRPLRERRAVLEQVLTAAPPVLALCPQTTDVDQARLWFDELGVTGAEGVLIKDLADRYRPGKAGWWKYKRFSSVEAILGGVTGSLARPRSLLLGRLDGRGRLRFVARSTPLAPTQQQEIAAAVTAAAGEHPWPQPLPASWIGQLDRREAQPYVAVEPLLVAEIVVDAVFERGRYRHPVRHLRLRGDLAPADVQRWQTSA